MKLISSRQNSLVKAFRDLARAPDPNGERLLLDGVHLVREALAAGVELEVVAVATSRLRSPTEEGELVAALTRSGAELVEANEQVFAAISPVKTPSGMTAIARRSPVAVETLCAGEQAFVLTLSDVQDPGNVGALLRAAEATGASGALVCRGSANPFSWKALRGSMGSALRLPIVGGLDEHAAMACFRDHQLRSIAAVPRSGRPPDAVAWRGRVALWLGGEGSGLHDDLVARCDEQVTIPLLAPVESLNVASAGSMLMYVARRQREGLP